MSLFDEIEERERFYSACTAMSRLMTWAWMERSAEQRWAAYGSMTKEAARSELVIAAIIYGLLRLEYR